MEELFTLGFDALLLHHREFELCVRTEESWPLSSAAKSRWAAWSLKMCFACLVTLKATSCHSYSADWQRGIGPRQIVLATGPYMLWTLKLALAVSYFVREWNLLQGSSVHESSMYSLKYTQLKIWTCQMHNPNYVSLDRLIVANPLYAPGQTETCHILS